MELFKQKTLYCPACGEKMFLKSTKGGLSKRETIWYYKCEGCGLRTGKRLTVDEAVEAAVPTEKAKALWGIPSPAPTQSQSDASELSSPRVGSERPENSPVESFQQGTGGQPRNGKDIFPQQLHELDVVRIAEKVRNLEHRILLLREKQGLAKVGCGISFMRMTMVLSNTGTRETTWTAELDEDGGSCSWENHDVFELLEKVDADVTKWEEEV